MESNLPPQVKDYVDIIVERLADYLKDQLVGVYLFGSAGYGAYEPGNSDLDVQAVVKRPLSTVDKQAIASQLSQKTLPCPATKLEFVIYSQHSVYPASRHPRFELNLNTGPDQTDQIGLDPSSESSHWFLLDIAMGRQLGRCLYGLTVSEAFDVIPRRWILEAMEDSLQRHLQNEAKSSNHVLNTCRSWQFVTSGKFSSKLGGANWAKQQPLCPVIVQQAIEARKTKENLIAEQVKELDEIVLRLIRDKLEAEKE